MADNKYILLVKLTENHLLKLPPPPNKQQNVGLQKNKKYDIITKVVAFLGIGNKIYERFYCLFCVKNLEM